MTLPAADSAHPTPPLSCLVSAGEPALASRLAARLERSSRVSRVERLDDAIALEHALAVRRRDLVVHVLDAPDEPLPRCLRRYPELRVLVVAPDGVTGTLSHWLQQGANELVSPDDEDGLAHAISRLLDECALQAALRRQNTVIATQRRRIEALTARLDHAPERPRNEPASHPLPLRIADSADGLPGRRQSLKRLIALRAGAERTDSGRRAIALQVTLPFGGSDDASRLDRTLGDLAVFRGAETIRRLLPRRLLLGRTRRNTLVVLARCDSGTRAASVAADLRSAFGSLGELLDDESDLSIDALDGALSDLAAPDLLERLERRRERRSANANDDAPVVQVLPVLNARAFNAVAPPSRPRAISRS